MHRWGQWSFPYAKLEKAVKELRDTLREFPGSDFDSMLREAAKIKPSSPSGIARAQIFLQQWCSENDFGRINYEVGSDVVKDAAFDKIVNSAMSFQQAINSALNVEAAFDKGKEAMAFQVACIDAGCVPGLVRGGGRQALANLRQDLVQNITKKS